MVDIKVSETGIDPVRTIVGTEQAGMICHGYIGPPAVGNAVQSPLSEKRSPAMPGLRGSTPCFRARDQRQRGEKYLQQWTMRLGLERQS